MKKAIELTVTLKLNVDYATNASEFYSCMDKMVRFGFSEMLSTSAESVRIVAAYDPDGEFHQEPDLAKTLRPLGLIADIWSVEDVLKIRPDLDRSQAFRVLQVCVDAHDANFGITWDTLSFAAEQCFGEPQGSSWELCG